jgi:hypothetical protein
METVDVNPLSNCYSRLYDGSGYALRRRGNHRSGNTVINVRDAVGALGCWSECHRFRAIVMDDRTAIAFAVRESCHSADVAVLMVGNGWFGVDGRNSRRE